MLGKVACVGEDEALGLLTCAQVAVALPCSAMSALPPGKSCHGSPAPCCRAHRGVRATPGQSEHGKQQRDGQVYVKFCLGVWDLLQGNGSDIPAAHLPALSLPAAASRTLPGTLLSP